MSWYLSFEAFFLEYTVSSTFPQQISPMVLEMLQLKVWMRFLKKHQLTARSLRSLDTRRKTQTFKKHRHFKQAAWRRMRSTLS
jgi:hypothetical protein